MENINMSKNKLNKYYIFEELKFQKEYENKISYYDWFYYFDNIKLKLDQYLSSYLNYAYYLLNICNNNNNRNILFLDSYLFFNIDALNIDESIHFIFNNAYYNNIEKIINEKKILNKNINDEQYSIINFLKVQNIKNMLYINDIFEKEEISISFLIEAEKQNEDMNIKEYDQNGILKGYDIILLRHTYEILYLYKTINTQNNNFLFKNDEKLYDEKLYDEKLYDEKLYDEKLYDEKLYDEKLYDEKLYDEKLYDEKLYDEKLYDEKDNLKSKIKKEENNIILKNNQEYNVKNKDVIINEKEKYKKAILWRAYLLNKGKINKYIILDALNICSGMDGYVENENFNYDILLNDENVYLIKYKVNISIFRLIYAVKSLLEKDIKPIVYIPNWWFNKIEKCENHLKEDGQFHKYIMNELKKDGLLIIGPKQKQIEIFTMTHKDIDEMIKLAEEYKAVLCTNNDNIINEYINVNKKARVSKFILRANFFMLSNSL